MNVMNEEGHTNQNERYSVSCQTESNVFLDKSCQTDHSKVLDSTTKVLERQLKALEEQVEKFKNVNSNDKFERQMLHSKQAGLKQEITELVKNNCTIYIKRIFKLSKIENSINIFKNDTQGLLQRVVELRRPSRRFG